MWVPCHKTFPWETSHIRTISQSKRIVESKNSRAKEPKPALADGEVTVSMNVIIRFHDAMFSRITKIKDSSISKRCCQTALVWLLVPFKLPKSTGYIISPPQGPLAMQNISFLWPLFSLRLDIGVPKQGVFRLWVMILVKKRQDMHKSPMNLAQLLKIKCILLMWLNMT